MKQQQLNLVLGAVALAMLGAVLLTQHKKTQKVTPLTSLSADAISRIAIRHPGKPEIDLEKNNGAWALTAPVAVAADPYEVKSLTDLATAEVRSTIDDLQPQQLKDFGLDPAAYQIVLNDQVLEFGGTEPLRYQRYIKTIGAAGAHVALIDDPQSPALDANYSDLVSKRLLPQGADVARIEVPGLVVARAADGPGWTSTPSDAAATSDRLQKLVDAWREASASWNQAVSALAPADSNPETAPGHASATVTLSNGSALVFRIASREPQLVLERSDLNVRYNLPKTAADQLLALPAPTVAEKPAAADKPAPADHSENAPAR